MIKIIKKISREYKSIPEVIVLKMNNEKYELKSIASDLTASLDFSPGKKYR